MGIRGASFINIRAGCRNGGDGVEFAAVSVRNRVDKFKKTWGIGVYIIDR